MNEMTLAADHFEPPELLDAVVRTFLMSAFFNTGTHPGATPVRIAW
jgi:hypothetical protein